MLMHKANVAVESRADQRRAMAEHSGCFRSIIAVSFSGLAAAVCRLRPPCHKQDM